MTCSLLLIVYSLFAPIKKYKKRIALLAYKRLDKDLKTITKHLQPFTHDLTGIVVGPAYNWYWLVDGLIEKDYNVHLANT